MMQHTLMHYIGGDLVAGGFVRNEDWVPQHVAQASALFQDDDLKIAAGVIAAVDPHALDYIRQCPALVLAMLVFRHQSDLKSAGNYLPPSGLIDVRRQLAALAVNSFSRFPKLKHLIAEFGLCQAQRSIHGYALSRDMECWHVLRNMRAVPPSVLAQAIPEHVFDQIGWMRDLSQWVWTLQRRADDGSIHFEWAVRNLGDRYRALGHSSSHARQVAVDALADYLADGDNGEQFNPAWDRTKLAQVVNDWHDELRALNAEKGAAKRAGKHWDEPCDYGDLPIEVQINGLTFVALRSGKDLFVEGRSMRHCVSTYTRDVMKGNCRIYGLRNGDQRLATLEIRQVEGAWAGVQFKGKCNAEPAKPGWEAADAFLRIINGVGA